MKSYENLKIQNQNLTRKLQNQNHSSQEVKNQINKTMAILNETRYKTVDQGFGTRHGRRNTLATQTGEDKDFIHMGEGNTDENNQGLYWHERHSFQL